jgi:predicted phosphodiesterase
MSLLTGWKIFLTKNERTIVLLPDYQIPLHDKRVIESHVRFVADFQPDALYHVGDFVDSPEPSRWNKGMAGEYAPTLQAGFDESIRILEAFRSVYGGPFGIRMGNHDERVETYVSRYAPALEPLRALRFEALLETERLGVDVYRSLTDIAPGWVLAHGHEGGLRHTGGLTAAALAQRIGKSVVCGHTHKAALVPAPNGPQGYNGRQAPTLWGMEVGHAMDIRKAQYLKTGSAGWQHGLGILRVRGNVVEPELVIISRDGSFTVAGKSYGTRL